MLSDNAATLFVTNYTQYMYLYETNVYSVSFSAIQVCDVYKLKYYNNAPLKCTVFRTRWHFLKSAIHEIQTLSKSSLNYMYQLFL